MTKIPKEIQLIQKFLTCCKYENISDEKYIYYKSPQHIQKTKSCVCFDGAMYGFSKLKELEQTSNKYKNLNIKILTIKGIKKENSTLKNVAHSVCIYTLNNKFGCIGKSGSPEMETREPIYNDLKQLAISFTKDLFNRGILAQSYFIEDETNFPILLNETTNKLYTQNQICKSNTIIPNYLEIKEITQYLTQIWNIPEEKITELLTNLRSR
jgi:hypothetical protein